MINPNYKALLSGKSVIRELSEYATERGKEIGYDNVFDYSLGNPSVPCTQSFTDAMMDLLQHSDPVSVHGYSPSLGIQSVRTAVAESLNARFGTCYEAKHIFMTCGAAGAVAHAVRCVTVPGDEVLTFAPFFPEYIQYVNQTGAVLKKQTSQGFCDDSAWSRGQAWGLYGYTMMFRESGDSTYLKQARGIASFIIPLLPEDGVPDWDFNAPGTAHPFGMDAKGAPSPKKFKWKEGDPVLRDSSAGAIIASALIELSTYGDPDGLYLKTAEKILRTLASPEYLAEEGENGDFLLKHGVTNLHAWSGVDIPLTYGDYYFLEALIRYKNL